MANPTISIKAGDKKMDLTLDSSVESQLSDELGENIDPDVKLQVIDFGDLDPNAMETFPWTIGNAIKLGEVMDDHGDADQVQAAWARLNDVSSKPDVEDIKHELDNNLTWQGSVREDEKDYVQYLIDEELLGQETLDRYFDFEKFGEEALMDARTTVLKDGRIVVWNG
jgi:antirestriction protein